MAPSTSTSTIQVSELAAAILGKERNAYWRPVAPDIRVEAVEFSDAAFLAGPFDKRFGLVYIAHTPDVRPLQELLDETAAKVFDASSTTYLPYSARQRIRVQYPDGVEFHWDPVARQSYSEIDLPHISDEVRARLESKGDRCGEFANTEAGRAILFGSVTPEEHVEHRQALEKAVARIHVEMRVTERCAERPYSVRLQGNDDASWTATCATLEDVDTLLKALRTQGRQAVSEHMYFTN